MYSQQTPNNTAAHTAFTSLSHLGSITSFCAFYSHHSQTSNLLQTHDLAPMLLMMSISDVYLSGRLCLTCGSTRHTSGPRLHKLPDYIFAPAEISICCFVCWLYFHISSFLSSSQSPEEGAVSSIFCAVSQQMEGVTGKYCDSDCYLVLPAPLARDAALAVKDFEVCERLTSKL